MEAFVASTGVGIGIPPAIVEIVYCCETAAKHEKKKEKVTRNVGI